MTRADPTGTIHFKIASVLDKWLARGEEPLAAGFPQPSLEWNVTADDPEARGLYAITVNSAWALLAFACGIAMLVFGVSVRAVFGAEAGNVVLDACLGAVFFCLAGCANVLWRKYSFVPQAQRLLRLYGAQDERYLVSMRRTLPRNTSLIFQAAVGIFTFVVAG